MDFDLQPDEKKVADLVLALVADDSLPETGTLHHAPTDRVESATRTWLKQLARIGFLALAVGEGRKHEMVSLLAAQKELAKGSQWLVFCTEMGRLVASLVADLGSPKQKESFLGPVLSGEWVASVAYSEPSSGSTPPHFDTTATSTEEGWVLDGEKSQVSMAPMADLTAVFAQTDDGPAVFLVRKDDPGVTVGERIHTVGYEALHASPLKLARAQVPADRCLRAEDPERLMAALRHAEDRAVTSASLGILWRCFEKARQAADKPRASGKPPAGYQAIRFMLAEMLTQAQTAEILAFRAFAAIGTNNREADSLMLCAKVFATEAARQVSDQAMQILASSGYRRGNPVERAFRNARLGTIVGHTSEVARMAIADDVLERMKAP